MIDFLYILVKQTFILILTSKKRSELSDLLIKDISQKIIFIIGCQKIGLTFTFLEKLKFSQNFYINFEELNSLSKTIDKRKYIFQKFLCLFDNYSEYDEFINKKIFGIKGYDNILKVITEIIEAISEYNDNSTVFETTNIILDNYDDYLVGNTKLSIDYVDNLYKIIKKKDIRIFILGKGLYINYLLMQYFFKPYENPHYILFKYYTSLDVNVENIIHMKNKENNFFELGNYLKNKTDDKEYLIYKLILIKNIQNIINENFEEEIPFQFLKFQKIDKKLEISFQFDDLFDLITKKIREYISKMNSFKNFSSIKNQTVKGFIFKEIVLSIFLDNKSFQNLNFPLNNIVEVDQIYNMEKLIPQNKFEKGPILIIQKYNGEVFDLGIVTNQNNIEYFIGIKTGLNKTEEEIKNFKAKLELNEEKIINDISTLTNRKITQFRFIIILHKETQNEVKSKYENEYITLFLFSTNDFCFYQQDKKNEDFNPESFNYIRHGLEYFCIKQYNLIPIETKKPILSEKEKNLLLNEIKLISPNIEEISIKYQIKEEIPLLVGTPPNCGILSITNQIKVFTYFNGEFIHFLLQKETIKIYYQKGTLFKNEYNDDNILNRFFVELINKKDKIEENKMQKKIKIYFQNNLMYLQKKRMLDNEK